MEPTCKFHFTHQQLLHPLSILVRCRTNASSVSWVCIFSDIRPSADTAQASSILEDIWERQLERSPKNAARLSQQYEEILLATPSRFNSILPILIESRDPTEHCNDGQMAFEKQGPVQLWNQLSSSILHTTSYSIHYQSIPCQMANKCSQCVFSQTSGHLHFADTAQASNVRRHLRTHTGERDARKTLESFTFS